MDNILDDIDLRPLELGDFGFILKTYTKALHNSYPNNFIPNEVFYAHHTQLLNKLLQSGAQILVANVKGSPDDLVGYMIGDLRLSNTLVLHWVHVKAIFRHMGVARELLRAFEGDKRAIVCTHHVKEFNNYRETHPITYNPYLLG